MTRIAICAPSTPLKPEDVGRVQALAADYPALELVFHPQCFEEQGHFAGPDAVRLAALLECANDPGFDAVWCARGGYGANRIAAQAVAAMGEASRGKLFLGYSDAGYLLSALYRTGIGKPVHAPMPVDIRRFDGELAVRRSLAFLAGDPSGIEPSLDGRPTVAFNLMTLAAICGTGLMPDLSGHVVMVEEVSEHLYAVDRLFFHVSEHLKDKGIAGLRLGRVTDVPTNDRQFGVEAEEIAQDWCARTGIAFLGFADIGHDPANKIVPFGLA
ncbi:MAG: LD-carboxypeptidase [Candidatus Andeanibacterium colombiense]|uniref:LD-carboxypeptidase n=1 Tax=Candidatus Andeanibacterium colombiense TaxID=3121345 RepID=A0AAJ5X6B8_9SPHN|nr:MAG: LD-carboxypeptidase [Sphingomonadaceae bacterium]